LVAEKEKRHNERKEGNNERSGAKRKVKNV
jgi:hypothetical protein